MQSTSQPTIRLLLVEDDPTLSMILKDTLEEQGFCVQIATDGMEGLKQFFEQTPEVVVADIMMPRMDGLEMLKRIRERNRHTPVMLLTARSQVDDVVEGFETGANDYLKKPFSIQELIVRVKALLGRMQLATDSRCIGNEEFTLGIYRFNPVAQRLSRIGHEVELSHRESEILRRLCLHGNRVVNTKELLLDLWGDDSFFNTRSLHVFITKLRKHLAADKNIRIINIRGIGYKLLL